MNITITDGTATITMSVEELMVVRYVLNVGTEELEGDARFMKSMKLPAANSSHDTAQAARTVSDAVEAAVQAYRAE